jgi:hypothetical protein
MLVLQPVDFRCLRQLVQGMGDIIAQNSMPQYKLDLLEI